MAGMGKRMRPHTLTIPKPLLPVGGKPIVQRLVEDIAGMIGEKIEQVGFVVGRFGIEVEEKLKSIANGIGAEGKIYYQEEPLGTAHAILCAEELMQGKLTIAFADTLFYADFKLDIEAQGIIWVQKVNDPSSFGVVKTDTHNIITDFVEKPVEFVSDQAIIGIYYVNDGKTLKSELQYLIDNNITEKGEYQLTNALENMKNKGFKFKSGAVAEWLDCGNKDATVYTNQRVLELHKEDALISPNAILNNVTLINPCWVDDEVEISNSVIGPHVSIGKKSVIKNSIIKNSIIQESTGIENKIISNSMIGNHVNIKGKHEELSIGDYTTIEYE